MVIKAVFREGIIILLDLNFSGRKKLPIFLQVEQSECGLACIAMIASYHGHDVNLNGLRYRFSASLKGTNLKRIIDIAESLDMSGRAIRVEMVDIPKIKTPAIMHWDLNHFIVLNKVKKNTLIIHDPARGSREISIEEASKFFTGVALEVAPNSSFTEQKANVSVKLFQVWASLTDIRPALIQIFILSVVLQLISLVSPFYLQLTVDEAIGKFDSNLLVILAVAFLCVAVIQQITSLMRSWAILYFGNKISFQMISNIFSHLLRLPVDYFDKRHVGDILARMGSTAPIQTALTESVVAGIIDGVMAIITGIVIFLYSEILGWVVVLSISINFLLTLSFYPVLRRKQEESIVTSAKENTHRIESIRSATAIKIFSAQKNRLSIWRNLFVENMNAGISLGRYEMILGHLHGLVGAIQSIIVIYIGASLVISSDNAFTIGMLFAFMSYRQHFTSSMVSLLGMIVEFRLLGLHLDRLSDIALSDPEPKINIGRHDKDSLHGSIEFKNVSFRYSNSDPWILKDVNIKICSKTVSIIHGPSGGGKTTFLKLLLGLYDPTEGEITINNCLLNDINKQVWRDHVGVVMQDDQLLSGTIADNISFFEPDLDIKKMYRVCLLAQIHDDIMEMPMEYLTRVGDMGSVLSGGQRQRVLLARALYRNPHILCLDEGTANIDIESEKKIIDSILGMDITRVLVAHRPALLKLDGDKLLVKNGSVMCIDS